MAPYPGELRSLLMPDMSLVRKSAVLVPLIPQQSGCPLVLLTLRSTKLNHHGGQISFPGGRIEPDETVEQAALREAHEEVGLLPNEVQLIGTLTGLYVPPSKNFIHPVVGLLDTLPPLSLDENEVAEAFTIGLDQLADPAARQDVAREIFDGSRVSVPTWQVHATTPLWGATAMILSELVALWEEFTIQPVATSR